MAEASQLDNRGGLGREHAQERVRGAERDADRLRGGSELGLLGAVQEDGVLQLLLQGIDAGLQLGATLLGLLQLSLDVLQWGATEGVDRGVGLAVEALARLTARAGETCDIAMVTQKDGGGSGDLRERVEAGQRGDSVPGTRW